MIILGVCLSFQSSACLLIDGEIKLATSEERFSRIKNDESYPINSINYLLSQYKISSNEIDKVAIISKGWTPGYLMVRRFSKFSYLDRKKEEKLIWYPRLYQKNNKVSLIGAFKDKIDYDQFPGKIFWKKVFNNLKNENDHVTSKKLLSYGKEIRTNIVQKHLNILREKIEFIDHSYGHICYSYYSKAKKNNKTTCVSIDAYGDNVNYSVWTFNKKKGKILKRTLKSNKIN